MSSERKQLSPTKIHLGSHSFRPPVDLRLVKPEPDPKPEEVVPAKGIFTNAISWLKKSQKTVDLDQVIDEMELEERDFQTELIAPNAPASEFRMLAQRIKGVENDADRKQIMNTVRAFDTVNQNAIATGLSQIPITAIPVGVKTGNIGEVEDISGTNIPFEKMPQNYDYREYGDGERFVAFQTSDDDPFRLLQAGETITNEEVEAKLALLQQREVVRVDNSNKKQKGLTAVVMLEDPNAQLSEARNAKPQVEPHNYWKNESLPEEPAQLEPAKPTEPEVSQPTQPSNVVNFADYKSPAGISYASDYLKEPLVPTDKDKKAA